MAQHETAGPDVIAQQFHSYGERIEVRRIVPAKGTPYWIFVSIYRDGTVHPLGRAEAK